VQAKRWMRICILRRSWVGRKVGSSSGFQGLLAESLRGQVARRLHPRASAFHETPGPLRFGLQALQRGLDHLPGDPVSSEIVPDGRIAVASFGKGVGPGTREAGVVDEPGARKNGERLFDRSRSHGGSGQPFGDPAFREIAPPKRASGNRERLGAPELLAQEAQGSAVERTPFHEA